MSRWRVESGYVGRYAGSGAFNTLVGFGIIFGLMWAGVSPFAANAAGYGCGFVLGFLLTRRLVFRSQGSMPRELARYVLVFALAYVANLAVLHASIAWLRWPPVLGQVVAAVCFTSSMYLMSRFYAFTPGGLPREPR